MDFPSDADLLLSDSFDYTGTGTAFPSSVDCPLDALGADLLPPSPILTPSQIAFSWSCGSIPVVLYDEAYAAVDGCLETLDPELEAPVSDPSGGGFECGADRDAEQVEVEVCDMDLSGGIGDDNDDDDDKDDDDDDGGGDDESVLSPAEAEDLPGYYDVTVGGCRPRSSDDSESYGAGSEPSTPRRASFGIDIQRHILATSSSSSSGVRLNGAEANDLLPESPRMTEIDPVAYQRRRLSVASTITGLQRMNALHRSTETTPTGAASQGVTEMVEASRWSTDSDSVFLSESSASLSGNRDANPRVVINAPLSFDPSGSGNDDEDDGSSSMQTPTKASLRSAVSWISSRSWDYGKYEAYVAREEPSRRALISNSLESYVESRPVPEPNVTPPNRRAVLGNRDVNVLNIDTPRAARTCVNPGPSASVPSQGSATTVERDHPAHTIPKDHAAKRAGSPRRPSPRPTTRARAPEALDNSWLADVCVQFLIDQEGFRAAEPKFKYTGTSRVRIGHGPSTGSRNTGEMVQMAHFRMKKPKSYHFHHAPFETPPILRRVTVNGDETHDYVSKQGLLTLKANGVYLLHGQEALVPASAAFLHGHLEDTSKLHWKLEYLVDDRVFDASQRIMDGEKVVTLLSFSCSPALVLPSQAKKNTIMHVFKKSVAPKLVAEKLQPPGTAVKGVASGGSNNNGSSATVSAVAVTGHGHGQPPSTITSSPTYGHIAHPRAKAYGWAGLHRRGLSHGARHHNGTNDAPMQSQARIGHRTSPSHGHTPPHATQQYPSETIRAQSHQTHVRTDARRRRNSCASPGERSLTGLGGVVNAPFTMVSSSRHHWEPGPDPPPLDSTGTSPPRHILPPEQLTKLLDSIAVPDGSSGKELKEKERENGVISPLAIVNGIGSMSSALTGKINVTIAGARATMGFATAPGPSRVSRHHQGMKSTVKDVNPI